MKTFAGYIRVSTVRQGEHGVSLQAQRDAITAYSNRYGLPVSEWYEERVTAAKRGRPVFSQMMRLLRQRKIDGVVMHKIDRSARNLKDWADLADLMDAGVEVHFAGDSLDLNTRGGRLSADIQAVVAADYIRNLREEAKKGLYGRLKQGIYPFAAPLGYLNQGGGKVKEPDPERAPLMRKAFELYGTGRYTLETLVREMERRGLKTREGKKVGITRLSAILNDPFYTGLIKIKRTGATFAGLHTPIITPSLFDRVQNVLKGNHNGWVLRREFVFSKLFTCAHCGHSLIAEIQKGHVYYRCHTQGCPTVGIREEAIEEEVLETLGGLALSEDEYAVFRNELSDLQANWLEEKENHVGALKLKLNKIRDRLDRLTDAYIDQGIDRETFEERKERLLSERLRVEEQIAAMEAPDHQIVDRVQEFLELASTAQQTYRTGNREQKRRILEIMTSNRTVDQKYVSTRLSFPFEGIKNRLSFLLCGDYRNRTRTASDMLKSLMKFFKENTQWENPLRMKGEET